MAASSETAPLLRQASISKANGQAIEGPLKDYDTIPSHHAAAEVTFGTPSTWKDETSLLARYSAPLVVTYVLQ